ncbi:fibrinogen alpha chain [Stigmatopora nigra]
MPRMGLVAYLGLLCVASLAGGLDPRGARPVVPNTRSEKCATEKEWPFCTDDDWGPKCPSGCRIQGLMEHKDHSLLKKIEKIRNLLEQNQAGQHKADQATKQTYDYLKERLVLNSGQDERYHNLALNLRQRISDMKVKIDRQLKILAELRQRLTDQVGDMQKLEVDIDIKLRSCRGSCKSYSEYRLDHDSYVLLDKQMNQLRGAPQWRDVQPVRQMEVMQSRPLQQAFQGAAFKSGSTDVFREVKSFQLTLETEGSSSSPATISKVAGTSWSGPSKSITELAGGGFGGDFEETPPPLPADAVRCTVSTTKTTVMTDDGPVEKVLHESRGGPGCQGLAGPGPVFPGVKQSAAGGPKGGLKGGLSDIKSGFSKPFGQVGFDLGKFFSDNTEDDVADVHARSVKVAQVRRTGDFTGEDCVDIFHKHSRGQSDGLFQIRASPDAASPDAASPDAASPDAAAPAAQLWVFCRQEGLLGGWLLVQQREKGSLLHFNRTWAEYRDGFGSVDAGGGGEMWLGNRHLHSLTSRGPTLLRVDLRDRRGGAPATAEYLLSVGTEEEGYPLRLSGYSGDAGDALASHAGMKFSTWDRDRDGAAAANCAAAHGGGWWYADCREANLNEAGGAVWGALRPQSVQMFVRSAAL